MTTSGKWQWESLISNAEYANECQANLVHKVQTISNLTNRIDERISAFGKFLWFFELMVTGNPFKVNQDREKHRLSLLQC